MSHIDYYTLYIPICYIREIRSTGGDTLVASTGLQVMNAEGALHNVWPGQAVEMGSWATGASPRVGLSYGNVDVPGPTHQKPDGGAIYWTFILANSQRAADPVLVNVITEAAVTVAGALLGSGNILAGVAGGILLGTAELARLLSQSCDGVVAAHVWALTAAQLAARTSGSQGWFSQTPRPETIVPPYSTVGVVVAEPPKIPA